VAPAETISHPAVTASTTPQAAGNARPGGMPVGGGTGPGTGPDPPGTAAGKRAQALRVTAVFTTSAGQVRHARRLAEAMPVDPARRAAPRTGHRQ